MQKDVDNKDYQIAVIVSQFNKDITDRLLIGTQNILKKNNINPSYVICASGAAEIPYIANRLAKRHKLDAIIALGAVIYGETDHYYYIAEQVSNGCQRVGLDHDIVIGFGVLTTKTREQAVKRSGEQVNAGKEAALAVINTLQTLEGL